MSTRDDKNRDYNDAISGAGEGRISGTMASDNIKENKTTEERNKKRARQTVAAIASSAATAKQAKELLETIEREEIEIEGDLNALEKEIEQINIADLKYSEIKHYEYGVSQIVPDVSEYMANGINPDTFIGPLPMNIMEPEVKKQNADLKENYAEKLENASESLNDRASEIKETQKQLINKFNSQRQVVTDLKNSNADIETIKQKQSALKDIGQEIKEFNAQVKILKNTNNIIEEINKIPEESLGIAEKSNMIDVAIKTLTFSKDGEISPDQAEILTHNISRIDEDNPHAQKIIDNIINSGVSITREDGIKLTGMEAREYLSAEISLQRAQRATTDAQAALKEASQATDQVQEIKITGLDNVNGPEIPCVLEEFPKYNDPAASYMKGLNKDSNSNDPPNSQEIEKFGVKTPDQGINYPTSENEFSTPKPPGGFT